MVIQGWQASFRRESLRASVFQGSEVVFALCEVVQTSCLLFLILTSSVVRQPNLPVHNVSHLCLGAQENVIAGQPHKNRVTAGAQGRENWKKGDRAQV